jgi:UDP-N-acetylglucosamine 2-epimerase (non-hydrolysing)
VCVVGTRPDAIKSAPVIQELKRYPSVRTLVVATGQHREMLAQALAAFEITPDLDLEVMTPGQTLADITTRTLSGLDAFLATNDVQRVIAQGDTTTTFVAGLAAFYRQIPFGHVEAGLRTNSIWNPFPEEFNRRTVGLFADQHYAPTEDSADNLRREGIDDRHIFVTGNTGIDAVKYVAERSTTEWFTEHSGRLLLLTTHRRENWGEPMERIALAARAVLDSQPDALLVGAMHRNPAVREILQRILGDHPRVRLIEPPDYADFVKLMQRSHLILSDSGGVQEEAPAFGRPVLVLRETTERPEGVVAGVAKLVGTDHDLIVREARTLMEDEAAYAAMARARSPYGDGRASQRIRYLVLKNWGLDSPAEPMWES